MFFYDLASAFDTVEFSVLLTELFTTGIQGKCWRLISHWYRNLISQVKLENNLSRTFCLERGIRQGLVLSPSLFNLVLDPLLSSLKQQSLGLSINGLYLGAFSHANDISTSATNTQDVSEQAAAVHSFTSARGLSLSLEKCAVLTSNHTPAKYCIMIGNTRLPVESAVKCLGIWWDFFSSSKISIDDRIHKARATFFAHGELGAFQGQLNPLSSRSLAASCIFPVLMYGSESWTPNKTLLTKLESFQAEVDKRILQLPKFTSNTIPLLALNWPSMCARILCSKISYLHRICNDQDQTIKSQTFNAIAASDVHSLDLDKQCKFLESHLNSLENLTEEVLSDSTASKTWCEKFKKMYSQNR